MKKRLLAIYQALIGTSDTVTGLLLVAAPSFTLRLMHLHTASVALPFLAYIGIFVLSVGIACFYGTLLAIHEKSSAKLEVVWLLTGITRALVAVFVVYSIASKSLEAGWLTVACTDGVIAFVQLYGLSRGWLKRVYA